MVFLKYSSDHVHPWSIIFWFISWTNINFWHASIFITFLNNPFPVFTPHFWPYVPWFSDISLFAVAYVIHLQSPDTFFFYCLFIFSFQDHFHKILTSIFSPHLSPTPIPQYLAFCLPLPSISPPFCHTHPFSYPPFLSFLVGQEKFLYPTTCISYFPVVCKNIHS